MNDQLKQIAERQPLPCDVPPGGVAVVLVDGRVAGENAVQGPGRLSPERWKGKRVEAVLFPARSLCLQFDLHDLRSAEGVALTLSVTVALHIDNAVLFLTDVVRDAALFTEMELSALLRDTLRTSLAPAVRGRSLRELDGDPELRAWLGTVIEFGLRDESDLAGRSGLAVTGVDAFDLRCSVWDAKGDTQETYYLRAAVARAEAAGRKMLDEAVLPLLREHLPVKEELVEHKERFAELAEQEAVADERIEAARKSRRVRLHERIADWRSPPSQLRPELWRCSLGDEVRTAPLTDDERVYVATRSGQVHAFAGDDGTPLWEQPAELGVSPGDGLALAAGSLWVPGHDGTLYGLDPATGRLRHRVPIGGKLSSAPLVDGHTLFLSVDVDRALREGYGQVVAVNAATGQVSKRWKVSGRGLRAQPVRDDQTLYVGDRQGKFYALDRRSGRVERLPVRVGRILGAALVDEARNQVIVGGSYGQVIALDRAGRQRWSYRVGGPVVGRPLLHEGTVYVGAGDGLVYALNSATGEPLREPFATRGPVATSPAGWGDLVFAGSNDGYLYALESGTGHCFWQYHSGSPVCVPPAVSADGRLYVVDSAGHLNALRWCLTRYADAAQRAEQIAPPRWAEATGLWLLAGEVEAALEAAKNARRPDLVAEISAGLNLHDEAAKMYEQLARQSGDPLKAATWWAEAAEAWTLCGDVEKAKQCRLKDAKGRRAPLLELLEGSLPQLTLGQPDDVQVCVRNLTEALACDVRLTYRGHVKQAGTLDLGTLGSFAERLEQIAIVPTESGSATLWVAVHYADSKGRKQRVETLKVRLGVARPPEVHYHGPVVNGDGVIIMRGEAAGTGRTIQIQSGDDQIRVERPGQPLRCGNCGTTAGPGDRWCRMCSEPLAGMMNGER